MLRLDAEPDAADRSRIIVFARAHGLPRVHCAVGWDAPEPVCSLRLATLTLANAVVAPPAGRVPASLRRGLPPSCARSSTRFPPNFRRAPAELCAGIGTFTFALAAHARVTAFEADAAALHSLRDATATTHAETHIRPTNSGGQARASADGRLA